jgi:Tfp pilus assembly protein PilN
MAPENLATSDSLDNALDALQKHPVAEIGMELQRSQIPLLGGMVNWLRRVLHELVLFYVNRAVRQQAESHELYGALLQQLTASQQAQAAEIAALRAQLQALTPRGSPPVGDLPAGDLPK